MLLSDVCLSVAYIEPMSRTEKPRKSKIGTEVGHVTHVTRTPLSMVKRSKVNLQGAGRGHIVAASRTACYIQGPLHYTFIIAPFSLYVQEKGRPPFVYGEF